MGIDPLTKRIFSGNHINGPVSLMYHSVEPGKTKPDWPWSVSLHEFIRQLDLLQDYGWTTVCARNYPLKKNKPVPKTVFITFDDGYANNFPAFEELAKRNMLASWFIVTQDIGRPSSWSTKNEPSYPLLTVSQLHEMDTAGMEIGSHTHTHCRLTQVPDQQRVNELTHSKSILSNLLGKPVTSFAYPYGLYNSSVASLTQSTGYRVAFTTRTGFGLVDHNPLEVRRIPIFAGDTLSNFAQKLVFADNTVGWARLGRYAVSRVSSRLGFSS